MRIALVDDNPQDAQVLQGYLDRFSREVGLEWSYAYYSDGQAFLNGDTCQFDLIVIDVDMPGINGIETARLLRQRDPDVLLMFVTNMPQYALAGYAVDALDYLIKPVAYGDFTLKLQKTLRYLRRDRTEWITLHTTGGMVRLEPREILYVESTLHYLTYHTWSGEYRVRGAMAEAERTLQGYSFARCSRSYLVNLRHVRAIEGEDVVVETVRLKMTRSRREEFLERFTRFLGGMEP